MLPTRRLKASWLLFVALVAVVCVLAFIIPSASTSEASESHPSPEGAPSADNCTSSITIVSFTISRNEVAPGESITATLVARNTHWTSAFTHYYEAVLLDSNSSVVSGTSNGTEATVDDGPSTSSRDHTLQIPITVPSNAKDGTYFVRGYIRTESGGSTCDFSTELVTVKSPEPDPDPESCDGKSVLITALTFASSTRQGNGIAGHIRVRNTSDRAWPLDVRLEIRDPNSAQVFQDSWTSTLTTSTREFNANPTWTTSTTNPVGTYTVHASARSGGEVCHATFSLDNRDYTPIDVDTFELTDGNPPPRPGLSSPGAGEEITDTTPTLEWSRVTDPEGSDVSYDLQVSTNSRFSSTLVSRTGLTGDRYTIRNALPAGRYYWRVRSRDLQGNASAWTSTRRFRITRPTISVTITSTPEGRTVTVDGANRITPFTDNWESATRHTLNVPYSQVAGQTTYTFSNWSDGEPQSRTVQPSSNTTYTAIFSSHDANDPPTITAVSPSSTSLTVETGITGWEFSATVTDTDNNLSGYEWFLDDQPTTSRGNLSSATGTTEFVRTLTRDFATFEPGSYQVKVTFTDAEGESASRTWTVTVPEREVEEPEPEEQPDANKAPVIDSFHATVAGTRVNHSELAVPSGAEVVFSATATDPDPDGGFEFTEWYLDDIRVERTAVGMGQTITRPHRRVISNNSNSPIRREMRVVFHDAGGATSSLTWDLVVGGSRLANSCPTFKRALVAIDHEEVTVSQVRPEQLSVRAGGDALVTFAKTTHVPHSTSFYEKISVVNENGHEIGSTGSFASLPGLDRFDIQLLSHEYGPGVYSIAIPSHAETGSYTVRGYILSEDLSEECHRMDADEALVVRAGSAFGEESLVRGLPDLIPPSPGQPHTLFEFTLELDPPERTGFETAGDIVGDLGIKLDESFSGEGEVTVAFPRGAWVEHESVKRFVSTEYEQPGQDREWKEYGPTEELHSRYRDDQLKDIQERILQMADLLGKLTDKAIKATLRQLGNAIGTIPIAGDIANAAIDAGIDLWEGGELLLQAAELGTGLGRDIVEGVSELKEVAEEEPRPVDPWLDVYCDNFTNEVTIPWYTGLQSWLGWDGDEFSPFETVKAIRVQIPVELTTEGYVSLIADYETTQLEIPLNPLEIFYKFMSFNSKGRTIQRTAQNLGLGSGPDENFFNVETRQGRLELSNVVGDGNEFPGCDRSRFTDGVTAAGPSAPRIVLSPSVVTVQEGGTAQFTVSLDRAPVDTRVRVRFSGNAGTDAFLFDPGLAFASSNWDQPRSVTIRARDDDDADADAPIEMEFVALDWFDSMVGIETVLSREKLVIVIEEDDTVPAPPEMLFNPKWLSLSSETTPWLDTGGRLEVRVLTVDAFSPPDIAVEGPELSESKPARACRVGNVSATGIVRCWVAVFELPVNDTGAGRYYAITAESPDIEEDYVSEVYQLRIRLTGPGPVPDEQPPPSGEPVPLHRGLEPLGFNLQWVLHFDENTQEWLSYDPDTPLSSTLDRLVPGQVYWLGVEEDQTVVLGGISRTLKAGLNQVVW